MQKKETFTNQQKKTLEFVGYILLFNSILILIQSYFLETVKFESYIGSVIADVVFGLLLLTKPSKIIIYITAARAFIGLIIFGFNFSKSGDFLSLIFQVLLSISLIYLLLKIPIKTKRNIFVGVSFAIIITLAGLTSSSVIINKNLDSYYSLEDEAATSVHGYFYEYELMINSDNWFLRERKAALKENPVVDQWVVNPKLDAHIFIIGETLQPAQAFDLYSLKEKVIENLKNATDIDKLVSESETNNKNHQGLILHHKIHSHGLDLDYMHGLYIIGDKVFQIALFCKTKDFQSLENTFLFAINSFKYTGEIIEPAIKNTISSTANKSIKRNLTAGG